MKTKIILMLCLLCFVMMGWAQVPDSMKKAAGWHRMYTPQQQGANVVAALDFLNARGLKPTGPVVVGIVDSGVDTTNVNLQDALWTNPGEKSDGLDNDGNGYVDDVHGWNFLGTRDGSFNMTSAGTEEYRQFKRLYPKYKHVKSADEASDKKEYDFYVKMRKKANINSYLMFYDYARQKLAAVNMMDSLLRHHPGMTVDTLTMNGLPYVAVTDTLWEPLNQMILTDVMRTSGETTWTQFVQSQKDNVAQMKTRIDGIENAQDKRLLMGDDMDNADDRYYGNPTLTIDGCDHGTFVAGIIGGDAADDHRYDGLARGVAKLMIVRASPEGDEYDKDVASSIRYAVDNGARVINISLGKYYSPQERMVNNAIRYAADHDVLVVCAAGNNSRNLDTIPMYPSGVDLRGQFFDNFLRVGACDEQGKRLKLSNYGSRQVHLFAPGSLIASVFAGNKYDLSQGTSLAAPVVTAVAALIRSYFPYLSASQVKQLLMDTVRPMEDQTSISGGTIDMLQAVQRLLERESWYRAEAVTEPNVGGRVRALSPSPSWEEGTPFITYRQQERDYMVDARTGKTGPKDQSLIDSYRQKHPQKEQRGGWNHRYDRSTHTADSAFTMLGDRYNLHVRDNRTGAIRQLTFDGREYASYCGRSAADTLSDRHAQGYWKGHSYFCMVYDDTDVNYLNIVHQMEQPVRLEQRKMPLPGGNDIRRYHLYWYNADTQEGRQLDIAPNRDYFIQMDYDREGDNLYFLRRSRSVDTLELCRIHPETGKVSVVISEVCKPHVNVNMFHYHLLEHGRQVLWWSDRTGRGNYYLYDGRTGKLLNRVTQGDQMVAGRIEKIDTLARTMIFIGYGQEPGDPHYTHYYKVNLNGRGQQRLTHGDGEHHLQFSADGHYAIDSYSRMDMPSVYNVVNVEQPKKHFEFCRVNASDAQKAGWVKPTLVKVKAADEKTDLYGVMYTPSWLDVSSLQSKDHGVSLPIISNVYPGPQDDQIPRSFTVDENGNQSLAELGFVVINVQPRGSSPLRSRDFYCYGYGNLRDYPVADDRHTIQELARRYCFIDTTRVGIYGHSGGGFETVTAMLTYPDFYKVGVAASGNYDNRAYIQWWAETYNGYGRPIPTAMELAPRLKGRLLLMTGEVDENVPVASTIRMADALQKAGKRFDMMLFPEQGHGLYGPYYQNIIRYYFLEHLRDVKPFDIDIINHK